VRSRSSTESRGQPTASPSSSHAVIAPRTRDNTVDTAAPNLGHLRLTLVAEFERGGWLAFKVCGNGSDGLFDRRGISASSVQDWRLLWGPERATVRSRSSTGSHGQPTASPSSSHAVIAPKTLDNTVDTATPNLGHLRLTLVAELNVVVTYQISPNRLRVLM